MVDNVGSTELENVWLLGVFGLCSFLVNFGVFYDIWLSILKKNETNRLSGIALADDLSSDINVLGGTETNKDWVGDLHKTIVYTVCVNVLDSALTHVADDV